MGDNDKLCACASFGFVGCFEAWAYSVILDAFYFFIFKYLIYIMQITVSEVAEFYAKIQTQPGFEKVV